MKTYIRKNIKGYYIDFPEEIDTQYWKGKIGETYQDFLDGKWILLSNELIVFHNEHPNSSIKEVLDMLINSTSYQHVRTLEEAKQEMIDLINTYDNSSSVNGFIINGNIEGWLTPNERNNYRSSIEAAKRFNIPELSFYVGDFLLTVTPEQGEYMLDLILLYADLCFIVTKQHQLAVNNLETIEAVDAYDNNTGYPERLTFIIDTSKVVNVTE